MTDENDDEYDKKYDGLCPDKRQKSFERGVQQIADIARWSEKTRRSIKYPSKVKRELEQLGNSLHNLSLEAQSCLWDMGGDAPFYSPSSDLLGRVDLALSGINEGRPKFNPVRHYLGTHAASLWTTHGGDLNASEFEVFLQNLIEKASLDGKEIDSAALAKQMRKEYANCDPPHWDRKKP